MTVYLKTNKQIKSDQLPSVNTSWGYNRERSLFIIIKSLMILCVVSVLFYGYLANKVIILGSDIKSMEKKITKLKNDNEQARILISKLQSVETLEKMVDEMDMIEPTDVDYIGNTKEMALK